MSISEAQRKAAENYLRKQDEIKIRVKKGRKDVIRAAAIKSGKSLNGYIITAIEEKIERDEKRSN